LSELSSRQEQESVALVEQYRNDLGEVHEIALRLSLVAGHPSARGRSVLAGLGETAVAAIETAIAAQEPVPDVWLLFTVADGVASAESSVTARLRAALSDRRVAPQPPAARFMEETPPSRRVCDEAYLGLRRILHAESLLQYLMESQHFLFLPVEARNAEVEACRETGAFTRFLDDVDGGEE
jgi:hypothetical protein